LSAKLGIPRRFDPKRMAAELTALREQLGRLSSLADDGRAERIARALADPEFFARAYFPHVLEHEPSAFHRWAFQWMLAAGPGDRDTVAAPRGNAKTTVLVRIYLLWRLARGDVRFPVVLSDSTEQAEQTVEVIRVELEDNPRLAQDFPDLAGEGRIWQQGYIVTRTGVPIRAYGSGKRIRGANLGHQRPDLVICDDLESDEQVKSKAQRDKLYQWFCRAVLKLGPPDGSMQALYVGTYLHADAVMVRVAKRPDFRSHVFKAIVRMPDHMDLWEEWERLYLVDPEAAKAFHEERREAMEQGAVSLWPAVQPLYALMCARASDPAGFRTEMQNEPLDPAACIFTAFIYWRQLPPLVRTVGACDPALGKTAGDYAALVVLGQTASGHALVLEADIGRYKPLTIIERIITLQSVHHCVRWAVEEVAFQALLKDLLVQTSLQRGVPVPAVGVKPVYAKEVRIESLAPHVENGAIQFDPAHLLLLEQLKEYPQNAHDDGPDALEMAWSQLHSAAPMEFKSAGPSGSGVGRGVGAGLGRIRDFFKGKGGF